MKAAAQVALLFEGTNAYARSQLLGIGDYIAKEGSWNVTLADLGAKDGPPAWLARWKGDGVIIRGENRRLAAAVSALHLPCVDLTPSRLLPRCPWVKADDAAICQLAAEHFLERGFSHYAYCGDARFRWARERGRLFRRALRQADQDCELFHPRSEASDSQALIEALAEWVLRLPKPVAVFCCYDNRGQQVLEACRRAGLRVPEEVAVLGVDNDEVLCLLSPPPLSSIQLNPRRAGWEAAAMLARLMAGAKIPAAGRTRMIAPLGVVTRSSTDILAIEDQRLVPALRYIRDHACGGLRVNEVLRHLPMSRRTLETQFRRFLGRSPRQEIQRVQMNRAKELLVHTTLPVWEIAEQAGVEADHFSQVFRKTQGLSPRAYRVKHGSVPR